MSILLVEDDKALAAGLSEALRKEGFAINHVANGKDALLAAKTEPPEIVILYSLQKQQYRALFQMITHMKCFLLAKKSQGR